MDIEEVAEKQPHLIHKVSTMSPTPQSNRVMPMTQTPVDIVAGLSEEEALGIADTLQFKGAYRQEVQPAFFHPPLPLASVEELEAFEGRRRDPQTLQTLPGRGRVPDRDQSPE